mgnify:CR=1 FL=1
MLRTTSILSALLCAGCAVHTVKSDARRAWLDVTLDDPVEPARVLAFLDSYDPIMVGDQAVTPPTVADAHAWLDSYRTEARHWIAEVVQGNDSFEPAALPQATLDELTEQLVELVLELGPPQIDQPGWPEAANPYPWPTQDRELRSTLFGLYLQTGRLCPHASSPLDGCLVHGETGTENLPWTMAAQLLAQDPTLIEGVARPAERTILEALR